MDNLGLTLAIEYRLRDWETVDKKNYSAGSNNGREVGVKPFQGVVLVPSTIVATVLWIRVIMRSIFDSVHYSLCMVHGTRVAEFPFP